MRDKIYKVVETWKKVQFWRHDPASYTNERSRGDILFAEHNMAVFQLNQAMRDLDQMMTEAKRIIDNARKDTPE